MSMSNDCWSEDKFDREKLAIDLVAFIDSFSDTASIYGESKSLVVGVDAPYGVGKTFFLKALQSSESAYRAIAYVDAWADDIVNDPLVSVAATIRMAIKPWLKEPAVKAKWDTTARKAGKIATIATKGAAKQVLKLAISGGAVSGIEAVLDTIDDDSLDAIKSSVGDTFDDVSDRLDDMQRANQDKYLENRIRDLEEIRQSIRSLQLSLDALATELGSAGLKVPIIVIVDELDRCRPDYAIRMLEEIKHIFTSPKVCFILGINSEQLSKSLTAEYGIGFDGSAYLDRFIDRYFNLPFPDMNNFVTELWGSVRKDAAKELWFPQISASIDDRSNLVPSDWITRLLAHYGIAPRQVFRFFDRLRTSLALGGNADILMPYLAELIAIKVSGKGPRNQRPWAFFLPAFMGQGEWVDGDHFFDGCVSILDDDLRVRRKLLDVERPLNAILADFVYRQQGVGPQDYVKLLDRVGNFSIQRDGAA